MATPLTAMFSVGRRKLASKLRGESSKMHSTATHIWCVHAIHRQCHAAHKNSES